MTCSGAMSGNDPRLPTAENYRRFSQQAAGRSPGYEALALAVAEDSVVLGFLAAMPFEKRQPNLLFAAARFLRGPIDESSLRQLVEERPDELAKVMYARRTQTNEAARCATLLPALSRLPQPLALIEVGAAAGLTLVPDRYSYDYGAVRLTSPIEGAPTLRCAVSGPVPLPSSLPEVLWRGGVDLNPLDVRSLDDVQWLSCLVWPGEKGRLERLEGAVALLRRDPPAILEGDLVDTVGDLVAAAPPEAATVVVYHSAVLCYLEAERRAEFARIVEALGVHWISIEGPGVIAGADPGGGQHGSLLVEAGTQVLAEVDSHGTWIRWHD